MSRSHHVSWLALAAFGLVAFSAGSADAADKKGRGKKPAAPAPVVADATPAAPPAAAPEPVAPPQAAAAPVAAAPVKPTTEAAAAAEPDAKPEAANKTAFDASAAFALPVGNFADVSGIGFGAFGGVRHLVAKNVHITGRAGFIYHLSKDFGGYSIGTSELPLLAGVRYTFVPANDGGFYGGAELGMSVLFTRASSSTPGLNLGPQSGGDTSVKASTALNLGYQVGKLDARATMYFVDLGHLGDSMALMATVGYSFAEL